MSLSVKVIIIKCHPTIMIILIKINNRKICYFKNDTIVNNNDTSEIKLSQNERFIEDKQELISLLVNKGF